MPTYVFYCKNCDLNTEQFFSIADRPDSISCSKCSNPAQRVLVPTTFHLGEGAWASNKYTGRSNVKWRGDNEK